MPRTTYKKKITSPDIMEKINKDNINLLNRFLKEKSTRTSEKTIIVYESNMNIFLTWNYLYNDNKFFIDIKKLEFSDFFNFASEELKLGSSKLNNMRSVLSSFSNFIEKFYDDDYPNFRNVILKIVESSPKDVRREKTILTDEQIEKLLNYLSETDSLKACWLALAVSSGSRFSELLRFEVEHIDESRIAFGDIFLETTKQIKTKGRGKSGKLLYKYILRDKFLPYYKKWMLERNNIKTDSNLIFIKRNGNPITEAIVRKWIYEFEQYLGVPFYAHALRHYLVTLLSRKNIPHPLIKEIFGWSSLEMVGIYDDSTASNRSYPELKNLKI